ncbi:MAG: serine acetyltransferase [Bacteroidetes bacterium]|nr:serine acetyltransferase [Bacteroidota bacterium]MBU1116588.1 serine acetyltransferase [Bacteroidota bacterium]MBU1797190.1 serine acetyltransferase [Bacteroidota bacterium]
MINDDQNLSSFADKLLEKRKEYKPLNPIKSASHSFLNELLELLFPHYSVKNYYNSEEIVSKVYLLRRNLQEILISLNNGMEFKAKDCSKTFIENIPNVHSLLLRDAEAICKGDPAAKSVDEVILAYPGFSAIAIYRLAHELYKLNIPLLPRIFTEYAHQNSGIDIHPGATIGESFFIDHGTGIVIGETAHIGNNVKIYQGVTLGALSVDKDLAETKRHPTIEDDVIIYSNAVILGGKTTIGKGAVIGGNVWLTRSVPANSVVFHRSEINFKENFESEVSNFII